MLEQLHIQNYAIIDDLLVGFGKHLNIITGETGAGKSILMGALGLILGERADSAVLVDKEKKCVIEGTFRTKATAIDVFLKDNDLDAGESLLIRREITTGGKSRAFINDTPVNLTQLQDLSVLLVDLHQQFDSLQLGKAGFQRDVVDALAQNTSLLHQYQRTFRQYQTTGKTLAELKTRSESLSREGDYVRFQLGELTDAGFSEREIEELEVEWKLLENAEGIKVALSAACRSLSEGEQPLVQQLKSLVHQLQGYAPLLPGLTGLVERLGSVHIELQDIASELEDAGENVGYDPGRSTVLQERLSTGYRLLKKHGVRDTAALLELQASLSDQLDQVSHLGDQIAALEQERQHLLKEATAQAAQLSGNRNAVMGAFEEKVNAMLHRVGMPNARLKTQIAPAPLTMSGGDSIEFLFDANKSNRFEPVGKVASGGELSRLMLSIKYQVAGSMQLPTLIFDEIDSGISGEAARQVGIVMKELGMGHQVICITHQPQIAAKADTHYMVYKQEESGHIHTRIRLLKEKERVETIARMLSGEQLNDRILKVAREMILN